MPVKFRELPVSIQIAFGLTLMNSWVLFEEVIVDRTALARLMPAYGVGAVCIWDAGALLAVLALVWALRRRR